MIRLVKETDAEAIMNIRKEIILSETTTKFFIVSPKKLPNDSNAEREKIRKSNEKGNLYIVYEVDRKVVGFLLFTRYELERLQHAGTMGMGIKEAYCNQGIGTKLIEFLRMMREMFLRVTPFNSIDDLFAECILFSMIEMFILLTHRMCI